jgi:B12-binding domain/radical SAM domain protein
MSTHLWHDVVGMTPSLIFRRTIHNRNSLPALIRALDATGVSKHLQIGFADEPGRTLEAAHIAAYSLTTMDVAWALTELAALRHRQRRPLLVAGGSHPSADPQGMLAAGFDVVFVGEGEESFPRFVREYLDAAAHGAAAHGATTRSAQAPPLKENECWPNPIRQASPQGIDLDWLVHADSKRRLFPFAEISRGCSYACGFCQVPQLFGRRMRHRSPAMVAKGVARVVKAGHRRIRFLTPDAFAYRGDAKRPVAESVASLLSACRNAGASQLMLGSFPSEVRPDHVAAEPLRLIRERCINRTLVLGAQSGSDRVLGLMNRRHTVEQVRRAVRLIGEAHLIPHVDLLFCFPGESPAERLQTIQLARWCLTRNARLHIHVYVPFPGTPAWPAPPERLEPTIAHTLRRMESTGRLDGYWKQQIAQGTQILKWRAEGKILV